MKKFIAVLVVMTICVMDLFAQKNPVFNNGFQYELEAGVLGGSMGFSYKFAKRFSLGAGFWVGAYLDMDKINDYLGKDLTQKTTTKYNYWYADLFPEDKYPRLTESTNQHGLPNKCKTDKIFLTGQFRPFNRVFSLILGVNVGYEKIQLEDYWYPYYGDQQQVFFAAPFTGFSFRMKNFYINLKGGLNMAGSITPEGDIIQKDYIQTDRKDVPGRYSALEIYTTAGDKEITTELPEIDISSLYAVLNFTWTLNIGHGSREKQRIAEYRSEHPKIAKVKKQHNGNFWNIFGNVMEGLSAGMEAVSEGLNEYNNTQTNYNSSGNYGSEYDNNSYAGSSSGSSSSAQRNREIDRELKEKNKEIDKTINNIQWQKILFDKYMNRLSRLNDMKVWPEKYDNEERKRLQKEMREIRQEAERRGVKPLITKDRIEDWEGWWKVDD